MGEEQKKVLISMVNHKRAAQQLVGAAQMWGGVGRDDKGQTFPQKGSKTPLPVQDIIVLFLLILKRKKQWSLADHLMQSLCPCLNILCLPSHDFHSSQAMYYSACIILFNPHNNLIKK